MFQIQIGRERILVSVIAYSLEPPNVQSYHTTHQL